MASVRVDWRASLSLVGSVLKYLSLPLLFPLGVAVYFGEDILTFAAVAAVTLTLGFALERLDPDPDIGIREGFLMVAATWLAVALVGTLPYIIAGAGTASTLAHPVNALFESMSGFTTTGATVMGSIGLEQHSHALLLWRQLTQWLGGMGLVVLAVAILPELSVGGAQLMDAEAPGPGIEKLTPRIAQTARVLWLVYLAFTVVEFLLLYSAHLAGLADSMGLYNAVLHPLTTLPTGGFSPEARSIEAFSATVRWIIIPFMVVAGRTSRCSGERSPTAPRGCSGTPSSGTTRACSAPGRHSGPVSSTAACESAWPNFRWGLHRSPANWKTHCATAPSRRCRS